MNAVTSGMDPRRFFVFMIAFQQRSSSVPDDQKKLHNKNNTVPAFQTFQMICIRARKKHVCCCSVLCACTRPRGKVLERLERWNAYDL